MAFTTRINGINHGVMSMATAAVWVIATYGNDGHKIRVR